MHHAGTDVLFICLFICKYVVFKHFVCDHENWFIMALMKFHNNCRIHGIPLFSIDYDWFCNMLFCFWFWFHLTLWCEAERSSNTNRFVPIDMAACSNIISNVSPAAVIYAHQMHITCFRSRTRSAFHAFMLLRILECEWPWPSMFAIPCPHTGLYYATSHSR